MQLLHVITCVCVPCRWLRTVSLILFLNKMDILKDKIEGKNFLLEDYFPEFSSYKPPQEAAGTIHTHVGHCVPLYSREERVRRH